MGNIDINNKEQILKECDFDYFYNSKKCSRELCLFFNDILQVESFDKEQALIDLGRIAITLNEQDEKIKELKEKLKIIDDFMSNYGYSNYDCGEVLENLQMRAFQAEDDTKIVDELLNHFNLSDENEILPTIKQSQNQKAIEVLEKVKEKFGYKNNSQLMVASKYLCDFIDSQITELRGGNNATRIENL